MENFLPLFGEFSFNLLDIISAIIFIVCVYTGAKKGLIQMAFNLVGGLLSFYITSRLYPVVSVFLKANTNIYFLLKVKVIDTLSVGETISTYIQAGEDAVISNLPLPGSITSMIKESNIPSVYSILNVSTLEDYIGSFVANMLLNIISAVAVFVLVAVAMRFAATTLNIIARLPVIRKFNKIGGALVGSFISFMVIWAIINLYCLLFIGATPANEQILNTSQVGIFIHEQNLLLKGFTHIFN